MTPMTFLIIALCYVGVLLQLHILLEDRARISDFYLAGKAAPWYVVAFGMIGATLSGVTFISVPGEVVIKLALSTNDDGLCTGYVFIMYFLLLFIIKMGLTVSTLIWIRDMDLRLIKLELLSSFEQNYRSFIQAFPSCVGCRDGFLGANVWRRSSQLGLCRNCCLGTSDYLFLHKKGGMATVIWTDTIQTACMLGAVIISVIAIAQSQGA